MSAFALRLIALLCMALDQLGLVLLPGVSLLRAVGRLALPLYCFLLCEGYRHTRSLRRYGLRLFLLALLSEVPFDLVHFDALFSPAGQNVVFTLCLSLLALCCYVALIVKKPLLCAASVLLCCMAAMLLRSDYAAYGVLLTLCFHVFADSPARRAAGFAALLSAYLLQLYAAGAPASFLLLSPCALLALLPISLYNGRPGVKRLRFAFYAAYPLGLLALYLIRHFRLIPPYWYL